MFKQLHLDDRIALRDADMFAKGTNRFRRHPSAPEAFQGGKARIIPSGHQFLADQFEKLALAHHRGSEIQSGEFDLLRTMWSVGFGNDPIVEGAVILKLQGADRVRDSFDGIRQGVCKVIRGIDAPCGPCPIVSGVSDPIEDRVPQIDVWGAHIDFGAQDMGSIGKLSGSHAGKEIHILVGGSVPIRTVSAWFSERAAVFSYLIRREAIDVGFSFLNQNNGEGIELLEIIRRIEHLAVPIKSQPSDVVLYGLNVLGIFGGGIRVVESQMADSSGGLVRDPKIKHDGLGVTDVEISIRLRRKSRDDPSAMLARRAICCHEISNEIRRG